MKKQIITIITALALVTSVSGKAFAEGENTLTSTAGITPDSILYPIDKAIDNLKVALSSGDTEKAKTLADEAQERLGEAEVMIEKGKTDLAQQAIDAYNTTMQQADDKLQSAADSATGVTTTTTPEATTTTTTGSTVNTPTDSSSSTEDTKTDEKLENAETDVTNKQDQAIDVLKALQDRLTGDIKDIVSNVLDIQEVKQELVANFVQERHAFNDAKKDYNMAKVDLKKVEKSGDQDAIKKAQDELKQKEQAYTDSKNQLLEAFKNKKEADKAIESIIQNVKQEVKDQTNSNTTTTAPAPATTPAADTTSTPAATTPSSTTVTATVQQQAKQNDKDDEKDDDKDKKNESKDNKGKGKEIKEIINALKEKNKGNNGNKR